MLRFKEYLLYKWGLQELKAKEKKESVVETTYIVEVVSFNAPNPHLLPLANSFNFNLFS